MPRSHGLRVPVLTTTLNGAAEILPEPWMAVPDPSDVVALSAALVRILDRPGLGEECRNVAQSHPASAAFDTFLKVVGEL
jgi:glycosyltransferase involved in cell wall biosynthesis